jgi:hypothetical protein
MFRVWEERKERERMTGGGAVGHAMRGEADARGWVGGRFTRVEESRNKFLSPLHSF